MSSLQRVHDHHEANRKRAKDGDLIHAPKRSVGCRSCTSCSPRGASAGEALVRHELCNAPVGLARGLAERLPDEPEAAGLLALGQRAHRRGRGDPFARGD
jgi:hypothetical protein